MLANNELWSRHVQNSIRALHSPATAFSSLQPGSGVLISCMSSMSRECAHTRIGRGKWLFGCERTGRPRQRLQEWYKTKASAARAGQCLAALPCHRQWAEFMGWLDGGGEWEDEERGGCCRWRPLSAVLGFMDGPVRTGGAANDGMS
jgi:hypothetical protein